MNLNDQYFSGNTMRLGLRPAQHVSLPHSVQVSNYWENGGLGTSYGQSSLFAGLGEFYERRHFFNDIRSNHTARLSDCLSKDEACSFFKAFGQTKKLEEPTEIESHRFQVTKVINIKDYAQCYIPTICLSIGETCAADSLFLPLRDTCGCSSHVLSEHAVFDSIRETVERQLLLRFWLTNEAREKWTENLLNKSLKFLKSRNLYKILSYSGEITCIDISRPEFPGTALLTVYGGRESSTVKYCAGLGYATDANEALEKSIIELWQTFRFMYGFRESCGKVEEIDEPYLKHFMQQDTFETYLDICSCRESRTPHSNAPLTSANLISCLHQLGATGFIYLREVNQWPKPIYCSKFTSPDLFLHMNNSKHINMENTYSHTFHDLILRHRQEEMVPFP